MGVIHIPRVIASCARGYYRRSSIAGSTTTSTTKGSTPSISNYKYVGITEPHKYNSRVGIFEIDAFAHMNHSAYLTQAEFARWEMSATNGFLDYSLKRRSAFIVTGAAVRYRREIGPLFRQFEIHSTIGSVDDRNLWVYHTFRYPGENEGKILAQLLIQAVLVQNRKVVAPREFMEDFGIDPQIVDGLYKSNDEVYMEKKCSNFQELERTMRESAAADDNRIDELWDDEKRR